MNRLRDSGGGPDELAVGERVLGVLSDHELQGVERVSAGMSVRGGGVKMKVEAVGGIDPTRASDGNEVIILDHDRERWLGFAVLETEHELGEHGELIIDRVGDPLVDIRLAHFVVDIESAVAKLERECGGETYVAPDLVNEVADACV